MIRLFRILAPVLVLAFVSFSALSPRFSRADEGKQKTWALYTWVDDTGAWNYSLVHDTDKHPDGSEVKDSATQSLEGIKSRISLLDAGSTVALNPLPVLNMEMHSPPSNTVKEFERVCNGAKLTLIRK